MMIDPLAGVILDNFAISHKMEHSSETRPMPQNDVKTNVQTQMIAAMKSGDKHRTQVLRMVLSEIKRVEADKPDADPLGAVSAYAKTLKKTMAEMEKLHQPERVSQLQSELRVVEEFLPKQLDDGALEKI